MPSTVRDKVSAALFVSEQRRRKSILTLSLRTSEICTTGIVQHLVSNTLRMSCRAELGIPTARRSFTRCALFPLHHARPRSGLSISPSERLASYRTSDNASESLASWIRTASSSSVASSSRTITRRSAIAASGWVVPNASDVLPVSEACRDRATSQ